MEKGGKAMVKLRGKVRPGLVVGIGSWGARVASAFAQGLRCRVGDVPVIRAAVLAGEDDKVPPYVARLSDGQTGDLLAELEATRRLDAVRSTRRAGWDVDSKTPTAVTLVAALVDEGVQDRVLQVAHTLCDVTIRRMTLGAVLLLCPARGDDNAVGDRSERWSLVPNRALFDDGCYLLGRTNADGLLLFDRFDRNKDRQDEQKSNQQADLVACWLMLRALTGLDAALAQVPLDETAGCQAFGLARWTFPLESLKAHLARRWQAEALERLLISPQGDGPPPAPFLERHVRFRSPWADPSAVRFRVNGEAWSSPALRLVPTLREALDQVVTSERERLRETIAQTECGIEAIGDESDQALTEATDSMLDEAGLGATQRFLDALAEAVERCIARCEQAVAQRFERLETLDARAEGAAQALEECTERFPPFRLRTLLGLIVRPWRLVRLWLLYREIGRRAGVYLSYCQSRWLLRVEAFEHQWQAARYARMAQAIRDEQNDVRALQAELERLKYHQTSGIELKRSVVQSIEDAALSGSLVDQLYRRVEGDETPDARHLLALYGPLSSWVREGLCADELGAIFLDHAWELFAFLDEVRLDNLLARSHSGTALRRHITALVEAAAPWWVGDETRSPAVRRTFVGLPDVERSPLTDLLPRRHACFSTGDRRQVFAIQVVGGVCAPSDSTEEGER